jgi:hypothetical protein
VTCYTKSFLAVSSLLSFHSFLTVIQLFNFSFSVYHRVPHGLCWLYWNVGQVYIVTNSLGLTVKSEKWQSFCGSQNLLKSGRHRKKFSTFLLLILHGLEKLKNFGQSHKLQKDLYSSLSVKGKIKIDTRIWPVLVDYSILILSSRVRVVTLNCMMVNWNYRQHMNASKWHKLARIVLI